MPHKNKAEDLFESSPTGYVFTFVQSDGRPSMLNYAAYLRRKRRHQENSVQTGFARAERAIAEVQARIVKNRAEVVRAQGVLKMKEHLLRQAEALLLAEVELLQKESLYLANIYHPKPVETRDGRRFDVIVDGHKIEFRGRKPSSKRKKK